jgi:hypothetical protein
MGLDGCNMGAPRHHQDLKRLADCIGEGRAVEEEGMGYFAEEEELVAGVERCWRVEVAGIDREAEVPVAREGDKGDLPGRLRQAPLCTLDCSVGGPSRNSDLSPVQQRKFKVQPLFLSNVLLSRRETTVVYSAI